MDEFLFQLRRRKNEGATAFASRFRTSLKDPLQPATEETDADEAMPSDPPAATTAVTAPAADVQRRPSGSACWIRKLHSSAGSYKADQLRREKKTQEIESWCS